MRSKNGFRGPSAVNVKPNSISSMTIQIFDWFVLLQEWTPGLCGCGLYCSGSNWQPTLAPKSQRNVILHQGETEAISVRKLVKYSFGVVLLFCLCPEGR